MISEGFKLSARLMIPSYCCGTEYEVLDIQVLGR